MKKYFSKSPAQTKNLAKKIANRLKGGEVLGLVGELGTGKTQFVKGLAQYFKIKHSITSPTFVLLKPYTVSNLKIPRQDLFSRLRTGASRSQKKDIKLLIHIDCYRLESSQEFLALGSQEYLNNPQCLTVIEWAEKVRKVLPKNTIWIKFKCGKKENERIITIFS